MNILVAGANGQLGNEIQKVSKHSQDHYIFTDVCDGYEKLDITNLDAIRQMVAQLDVKCISIVLLGQMLTQLRQREIS